MELIDKLNLLMKKHNIKTIAQLSRETNIPYTTLKSIFDGDVNDIRLSTSRKLCDFFHITLDDLLDDDISLEDVNIKNTDFRTASYNGIDVEGLNEDEIQHLNELAEFYRSKKKNNSSNK